VTPASVQKVAEDRGLILRHKREFSMCKSFLISRVRKSTELGIVPYDLLLAFNAQFSSNLTWNNWIGARNAVLCAFGRRKFGMVGAMGRAFRFDSLYTTDMTRGAEIVDTIFYLFSSRIYLLLLSRAKDSAHPK